MKKSINRNQRVADLIQTELAKIIQRDTRGHGFGMVTVVSVNISHDLAYAKIYVSVLDETQAEDAVATLNHAAKFLRYELAHAVKLRITPELKFIYDDSAVRGHRISILINNALKNKE